MVRIRRRDSSLLHSSFLFPVLANESLAMGLEIKNKRRFHRLALFFFSFYQPVMGRKRKSLSSLIYPILNSYQINIMTKIVSCVSIRTNTLKGSFVLPLKQIISNAYNELWFLSVLLGQIVVIALWKFIGKLLIAVWRWKQNQTKRW